VIARWHRLKGEEVFLLTGTDEHGQKVETAAQKAGKSPQEFVDGIVERYKSTWKKLNISNDGFIRTTDKKHETAVTELIKIINDNGDIYKGKYEGWYCIPDESFWTNLQLKNGKCPECGREVQKLKEESYFFRLGKYQKKLLEFYERNPGFLSPAFRANEIIARVKEGLKDLSITRVSFKWGVPFPLDKQHVVYVWLDALINYLSGMDWPKGKNFKKFWPADVHLVGKEINWFHSVIWPAMLFSAGIEPPKKVFSHGWWTVEGRKMSKSLGNVVDPIKLSEKYSVDSLRYFLVRGIAFGEDGDFSEKELVARINGELVADLGNLVYRVLSLVEKYKGKIEGKDELSGKLNLEKIDEHMERIELHLALAEIWEFIRATNKYVNVKEPWKLDGKELGNVLYNLLEAVRIISILVCPFLPETSEKINRQIGIGEQILEDCKFGKWKGKAKKGEYLFRKVE
jgi:methionyl-tRNA synthetase